MPLAMATPNAIPAWSVVLSAMALLLLIRIVCRRQREAAPPLRLPILAVCRGPALLARQLGRLDLIGLLTTSAVLTAVLGLADQELLKNLLAGLEPQMDSSRGCCAVPGGAGGRSLTREVGVFGTV